MELDCAPSKLASCPVTSSRACGIIKLRFDKLIFCMKILPTSSTIVVSALTPVAGEHPHNSIKFICSSEMSTSPLASAYCSFESFDLSSCSAKRSFKNCWKFFFMDVLNFPIILWAIKLTIVSACALEIPLVCLSFMKISLQHA